jgi:hypothetical protein
MLTYAVKVLRSEQKKSSEQLRIFSATDSSSLAGMRFRSRLFRSLPTQIKISQSRKMLGGHEAVRANLFNGLDQIGQEYSINGKFPLPPGQTVGVLAGLRIAADLVKLKARIRLGPNYCVSPRQDPGIFLAREVEAVLVPSRWVADFYSSELPEISEKVWVWPSGVDCDYWRPLKSDAGSRYVILYVKNTEGALVARTIQLLESLGLDYRVVEYGRYLSGAYLDLLQRSLAVIWLGKSESQGIAQFEAWSVDVPTFVHYDPKDLVVGLGKNLTPARISSAEWSPSPYLSSENGSFWSSFEELRALCEEITSGVVRYAPRKFVLNGYNLASAARAYCRLF